MTLENDYQIDRLSSADLAHMRALLNLFGDAFQEVETYCNHQPEDTYLTSLLDKEHFITLVAMHSNQVVGGLVAYELHKFEQPRSEIYIYDLAVEKSFRRRGIATELINALKQIAEQRQAYVIFVQADDGDEPAIQLYEKLGQREDVCHFDIAPENKG